MKPRIRRGARLLLALTAAATAALTAASAAAAAIPPVDPYQSYVDPGCLSFVEQPGVRVFRDMIMSRVGGTNGGIYARSGRLGIGKIDWNRRSISIWTTSAKVWNNYPCDGTPGSCHTNHVQLAFSWAGARQQTSWFTTTNRPGGWYPGGLPATPRRAHDFSGVGAADLVSVTLDAQLTANAVMRTPSKWSSSGRRPVKPYTSNGCAGANGNTFETSMTWSACA